jgi:hypothetical protein
MFELASSSDVADIDTQFFTVNSSRTYLNIKKQIHVWAFQTTISAYQKWPTCHSHSLFILNEVEKWTSSRDSYDMLFSISTIVII